MKSPHCTACGRTCHDACRPPCPPETCRCDACRRPPPCPQEQRRSFLLPRILASGRTWLSNCQTTLRVEGIPDCSPPFTLLSVSVAGEPQWMQEHDPTRQTHCLHLTIPLLCQVRDRCGCIHTGRSCVTVDVPMQLMTPPAECWRSTMLALPCVRLMGTPCPSDDACFDTVLEIVAECYMVRWEPCMAGQHPMPRPPQLPLYPQPPCMG